MYMEIALKNLRHLAITVATTIMVTIAVFLVMTIVASKATTSGDAIAT